MSLGSANFLLRKSCRFPEKIVFCLDSKEGNIASYVCSKTISRSMLDRAYAQTCVECKNGGCLELQAVYVHVHVHVCVLAWGHAYNK